MNANTAARLARLADPSPYRRANQAAIVKARKNLYNVRFTAANKTRSNAQLKRADKIKAVRNRRTKLAEVRAMNNNAIVKYVTKNLFSGQSSAILKRQEIKNAILTNKINEVVARAYLNRYNKYQRGKVSLGARLRATGIKNGSLRASQIKHGVRGLFYKPQFIAKAQAFRPFMRRRAIASSALKLDDSKKK